MNKTSQLNITELHHLQKSGEKLHELLREMWPNSEHKWNLVIGWTLSDEVNLGFHITITCYKQWDSLSARFGENYPTFRGFPIQICLMHNNFSPVHPQDDLSSLSSGSGSTTIEITPEKQLSCWGCQEDQPNQLAHMDEGGCLYIEDELNF